jgi:tripartite ATP-independent transporter DctM subunit
MLAAAYMMWIGLVSKLGTGRQPSPERSTTWAQKGRALGQLLPITLLIGFVVGSMYAGFASVTEAAAMGVLGALILTVWERELSFQMIRAALFGTVRTCSMIGLILVGALFLSKAMARLAIPTEVATAIDELGMSPYALILLLTLFYLGMGCFLDGLSTIVMTLPVTLPLVLAAGFDPVWFGIFLIITIEMAQVTPPVGFNLFVIRSLTGESIGRIVRAAIPFCMLMVGVVIVLTIWPGLVTWLPDQMRN